MPDPGQSESEPCEWCGATGDHDWEQCVQIQGCRFDARISYAEALAISREHETPPPKSVDPASYR